ncbi:MAG: MarR family transcriptional regulator [Rhodobacteraceae bacterium]|nr:MarR family transcriptional regulator [Paracoccaceae bacterium]
MTGAGCEQAALADAGLRGFVGYGMKRAMQVVQADLNATLAPMDLRMLTFSALTVVVDNPGLSQARLADALAIERPNLVLVVDELEQRALITRDPSPKDRRAYALKPTPAGVRLCGAARAVVMAHDDRMAAGLSPEARAALMEALRRIETPGEGQG